MTTKMTTYVSSLTLRLGPIVTNGKLISVQKSKAKQSKPLFEFVSPNQEEVRKVFVDSAGTVYEQEDLLKREVISHAEKETGVKAAVLTQEQIDAQKGSTLPKDIVNLTVHDIEEVDSFLYPGQNNSYVFIPDSKDPANEQWYGMLLALVKDSDKAFISTANIKNFEGIYRLTVWRGNLVLQKQMFPEDLNAHVEPDVKYQVDEKTLNKGRTVVNKMVKPFDFETYRNTGADALKQLVENTKKGRNTDVIAKNVTTPEIDLDSILDSFGEFDD